MATATFDRTFVVTSPESKKKILEILDSKESVKSAPVTPLSEERRRRSEDLLKQFLSRSKL